MKKNLLIGLIVLLIIGNVVGIYYFISYQNVKAELDEKNNELKQQTNIGELNNSSEIENQEGNLDKIPETEKEDEETITVSVIDETYLSKDIYKSYFAKSYDEDENEITIELILYSDNTCLMAITSMVGSMKQGTYHIEDSKLLLKEDINYGSDACYYINIDLKHIVTINKDGSISYKDDVFGKATLKETSFEKLSTINMYLNNYEELTDCTDM